MFCTGVKMGIVRAIADLNRRPERLHGVRGAVRIGLSWMGDVGTQNRVEQLAVGATPNVASRLQGLAAADTVTDTIQRLERLVQQCRLEREESVALLVPLLALTLPADRYASLQFSPQQQRQRTLETLLAMVLALAEQQPLLLIMEDVHWVDPSTLEWLGLLLDQGPTARILTLMTCRPTLDQLRAEQYAQEARQLARHINDQHLFAKSLSILGFVHQARGNLTEADHHFEASLRISRQQGYKDALAQPPDAPWASGILAGAFSTRDFALSGGCDRSSRYP